MPRPSSRPAGAGQLLSLLWARPDLSSRRGPDRSRDLADVVVAGIRIADSDGLSSVTMRAVARVLEISPMSLYSYVPGKDALLALMVDRVQDEMPRPPLERVTSSDRLQRIADLNRQLVLGHPWLSDLSSARPPLGPGVMAKYEYELTAFAGLGLDDVTTDDCLTYLLTFVHGAVRAGLAALRDQRESGLTDQEWWLQNQPVLARVFDAERYPTAVRVGTASATARGTAYDPDQAYRFGLARTIGAIEALVAQG